MTTPMFVTAFAASLLTDAGKNLRPQPQMGRPDHLKAPRKT
jgi:hypothetical protein